MTIEITKKGDFNDNGERSRALKEKDNETSCKQMHEPYTGGHKWRKEGGKMFYVDKICRCFHITAKCFYHIIFIT